MELLHEAEPELDEENMDEEAALDPPSASHPEPGAGALSPPPLPPAVEAEAPPRPPPPPPRPPRCTLLYSHALSHSLSENRERDENLKKFQE